MTQLNISRSKVGRKKLKVVLKIIVCSQAFDFFLNLWTNIYSFVSSRGEAGGFDGYGAGGGGA